MKDNYKVLGDYIEPVDERNKDLSINNLLGVSISKRFIPSIANIIGTDLSNYKIVRTGQFAYGPVTSRNGEKVSIAFLNEDDCIISSSYFVFKVTDTKQLDPQYLMLWFSRPEFDRYARYKSHGSVREIFDWDELCQVELPVPHIDKQKDIVKAYNIISDRIELKRKINDNLAAAHFDKAAKMTSFTSPNLSISMVLLNISEKIGDIWLSKLIALVMSGFIIFSASKSLVTRALNTAPDALCLRTLITYFVRQKVKRGGYLPIPLSA